MLVQIPESVWLIGQEPIRDSSHIHALKLSRASLFSFLCFLTNPHVSPARCVLANVSRFLSFSTVVIVILIRTFENVFGIMAVQTYLGFLADL